MYKIWRSSQSVFGDETCPNGISGIETDETMSALQVYTAEELQKIADAGFNAIWVHGVLRHLVKAEPFPELSDVAELQVAAMRQLIERAAQYGIRVFIYMQPPRAWRQADTDFWDKHPDIWGEENECRGTLVRSLCTSTPKVKEWLRNAGAELARNLPELAGVIMITASEFFQHCYSHRIRPPLTKPWHVAIKCPQCIKRTREEVIAEVITLIRDGIREFSGQMEIIAWNWSWGEPSSERKIIEQLPEDVIVLAGFERGGHKDLLRRPNFYMDEYSLGYAGPSEKCLKAFETVKQNGMRFMSKLQLGTTHELASVVSLPLIRNIYDKAIFHRDKGVAGFMGCWNFGNALPNSNVSAFNFFTSKDCPDDKETALREFAQRYFPDANVDMLMLGWEQFEDAMYYHPFTIAFLYHGPQNHTLALSEMYKPEKLSGKPVGRAWKFDERGDDLSNSYQFHHTQFNLAEIIERVGKLAAAWRGAVVTFKHAFRDCSDKNSLDELGNAIICGAIWRSTENCYRVYQLRKNWNGATPVEFYRLVDDELEALNTALPWVERDSRQGYHIEPAGYMFNPEMIKAKIACLENINKRKAIIK